MSPSANWDRTWGHKAMFGSAFAQISGEDKAFARMSAAALKLALLDAEAEVKSDPDILGPDQDDLLVPPAEGDLDLIDLHCQVLGLNAHILRDWAGTILDTIADRVRAERAATPSAEVICIAEARVRREAAAARDALFVFVPIRSRGRHIGDQLAMGF